MLHILINSPFKIDINLFYKMLLPNDSIIAIQDGVFIALKKNIFLKKENLVFIKLYLLKEDVIARGISNYISSKFNLINYNQFIKLTQNYNKYINW